MCINSDRYIRTGTGALYSCCSLDIMDGVSVRLNARVSLYECACMVSVCLGMFSMTVIRVCLCACIVT